MTRRGRGAVSPQQTAGARPRAGMPWVGLIVAVGVLVFGNSLWGQFIYDDEAAITGNGSIRQLWPPWGALNSPRDSPLAGRPIVSLSFAVNYALGGLDVRGYHVVNVAVHILCALLLFGIVRRTLSRDPLRRRFGEPSAGIAAACALIWMVHPLQTEAVNYLTQRTESMVGLFYLLTIYAAIRAYEPGRRVAWSAVSVAACAAGMASKEVMVTAPLMVALYDWAFRTGSARAALRERWRLYIGLAATWVLLAALIWAGPRSQTVGFATSVDPLRYALNQCVMLVRYVRLAVWPSPLVLDYGVPKVLTVGAIVPYAGMLAALVLAATVALVFRPPAGFLCAWFFVILAPTSSVVPIASEVGAERRLYLPLAGMVVLAVVLARVLLDRALRDGAADGAAGGLRRRSAAALAALVILSLGGLSARRNLEYRDGVSLWRSVLAHEPSWRAHVNLGKELGKLSRHAEATEEFRQAVRDAPDRVDNYYSLALSLEQSGDLAGAVEQYREFLKRRSDDARVHVRLGAALERQGHVEEGIAQYREALRIRSDFADAHARLASTLSRQQKFEEAAEHFRHYLKAQPDDAVAHNELGLALGHLDRLNEAITEFRRAVELRPNYAEAHFALGVALDLTGHADEGQQHLREAARLDPAMRDPSGPRRSR
jgi:protein O-mannosyl-transferase